MNGNRKFSISKTVEVSDVLRWHGCKEISVKMVHPECWDNIEKMKNCVRILFMSADGLTVVYRDFNEWGLEDNWEWCKEWLFDKIPSTIDMGWMWMYEHGYVPW